MTDNLKEREAFEAWFNKHHTGNDLARDGDDYEDFSFTQRLWMGWQGRSAIAQAQSCVPAEQTTRPANSQEWAGMDASTAYLLICRHADGWADIDLMMNEWRLANPSPQPAQLQALSEEEVRKAVRDEGMSYTTPDARVAKAIQSALAAKNGVNLK